MEVVPGLGTVFLDPDLGSLQPVEDPLEGVGRSLGVLQFLLDLAHRQETALTPAVCQQFDDPLF